jgi:putative oxidoreductase
MKDSIRKLYALLITGANSLQSAFLLFVRLYWGWQFVVDGWGKLNHLAKVTEYFGSLGLPAPGATALFVSILELVGGILLALGLGTRLIALLLAGNMTVAYITGDREAVLSFFSDPDKFIAAAPFSYWMASLIILFFGPGAYSLDALLARFWQSSASNEDPIPSATLAGRKSTDSR